MYGVAWAAGEAATTESDDTHLTGNRQDPSPTTYRLCPATGLRYPAYTAPAVRRRPPSGALLEVR
jgi:hypothetical protein